MEGVFVIILGLILGYVLNDYINKLSKTHHLIGARNLNAIYINARHAIINGLMVVGFYLVFNMQTKWMDCIIGWTFLCFGVVLAFIDFEYMILPTTIIKIGVGMGLVLKWIASIVAHNSFIFIQSLLAGIAGYILFHLIYYFCLKYLKKEALGFGDVRLMGMLGVYCGLEYLWLMILVASIVASCYGAVRLLIKRKDSPFPLGPFLNMATFSVLLWGRSIMSWYVNLIGI